MTNGQDGVDRRDPRRGQAPASANAQGGIGAHRAAPEATLGNADQALRRRRQLHQSNPGERPHIDESEAARVLGTAGESRVTPEPAPILPPSPSPPVQPHVVPDAEPNLGPVAWRTVPTTSLPPDPKSHRAGHGARAAAPGSPPTARPRQRKRKRRVAAVITGVVGELLITLGCLIALYVGWELVWTTVEAQAEVKTQVAAISDGAGWVKPDPKSPYAPKHTEPPPVDKTPLPTPPFGETWGVLHVPKWGYDYAVPIVEDTDRKKILNSGLIGHYPETAGPGQIGNFATAAHRTTYGAPYNRVQELADGDLAIVETDQYYFVYKVYGQEAVYPNEVWTVWPVPGEENAVPTKRLFTMTTCHPPFSAAQRWIVWTEMAYWADKSEGPLEDLIPPDQRSK